MAVALPKALQWGPGQVKPEKGGENPFQHIFPVERKKKVAIRSRRRHTNGEMPSHRSIQSKK